MKTKYLSPNNSADKLIQHLVGIKVSAEIPACNAFGFFAVASLVHLLSDQAMFLYFMKKSASNGRFAVLGNTFQGQKHGCSE